VPVADDEVHDEAPGEKDPRSEQWVPPPRHVAADRASVHSLRIVQHISESLAEAGEPDEPVVLDRRGPHRSIDALDRLLADAIDEEEAAQRDDPPPPAEP
jgi:hypothetical protein